MSTFTVAQGKAPTKPSHVITLRPSDFVEAWHLRPATDVVAGLRRVPDTARQAAALEATNYVRSAFLKDGKLTDPEVAEEEWNNVFIREAVAFAMCDPNDVTRSYFLGAQEVIGRALPTETIAKVWAEYHRWVRRTDVAAPKITDEEAARLGRLLVAGRLSDLEPGLGAEVRRLLHWSLAQLGADDVQEGDDADVYVVKGV